MEVNFKPMDPLNALHAKAYSCHTHFNEPSIVMALGPMVAHAD